MRPAIDSEDNSTSKTQKEKLEEDQSNSPEIFIDD